MRPSRQSLLFAAAFSFSALCTQADGNALNPQVKKLVDEVSEARIKATIEKLVSFGTRNTMSNADSPDRGIGAARQWIFNEMKSYSPRLQVRFDKWRVKGKQTRLPRVFKDVDLYDVVAVLPGKTMPETQIVVSGHYDSLNVGNRAPSAAPAGPGADAPAADGGQRPPTLTPAQLEENAALPAPGACDDGSGTAAVMELARVMSQYEFDKTLVFMTFAGEEQGLVGSTLEAAKAKKDGTIIEALLNNDIIGTETSGDGRVNNTSVNIYSDETMDSPSQELGRYARMVSERYIPSMKVNSVFFGDRIGRGGDHTPFQLEGFAAVRLSTPNEFYANQHHATDLLENMSVPYTTKVAKVNAVVMATLALSPKPPAVLRLPGGGRNGQGGRGTTAAATTPDGGGSGSPAPPADAGGTNPGRGTNGTAGGAGGRRPAPMIARGASGYDAVLQWRAAGAEDAIKGYVVVMRPTTTAFWEQEVFVGKVNTYTLKNYSIDDVRFGVKAIGSDGTESLVTPYVSAPRAKAEIETVQ